MKKNVLLTGLLALSSVCLAACGNSKDFNMSFEEALDVANHSALQDVFSSTQNFQQSFDVSTNLERNWSKINANLQANSNQNLDNSKSEFNTNFDINISEQNSGLNITWALDIKFVDDIVYLNLKNLWISWSEDVSFLSAMIEWFKNQRYFISMTWLSDVPNSLSYVKDAKDLNSKAKEVIINEWSTIYSGKFSQFNWYNAWKFSLDNEKLDELIKDYYESLYEDLDDEDGVDKEEIPSINIQNFEWYLVITAKDKVTTVIDSMTMVDNDININVEWFGGNDYLLNFYESWESLATISATKHGSNYDILLNASDLILVSWTITPKVSTSWISVKFDCSITIKSQAWENDTVVPLKGNRTYKAIDNFSVEAPENAQDLSELLASYLSSTLWSSEYDDFEDNSNEENDLSNEVLEEVAESINENTEEETDENITNAE